MQIVFFSRDKDLLELMAPLSEEKYIAWYGTNLPTFTATSSVGIIFFDFDDPDFNLESFSVILDENLILKKHFLKILITSDLSVKAFKKLQEDHKYIDGILRSPIKLKDIESFVEDYKLVLNETREVMAEPKMKEPEDPVSAKIQQKFDLVFDQPSSQSEVSNQNESTVFNPDVDDFDVDNFQLDGDSSMSNDPQKKSDAEKSSLKLDLDFDATETNIEFEDSSSTSDSAVAAPAVESKAKLEMVTNDSDLEFTLDFGDDTPDIPNLPEATAAFEAPAEENSSLDFSDSNNELDAMFDEAILESNGHLANTSSGEGTQKTIVYKVNKADLKPESEIETATESFELDITGSMNSTDDLMSTEEAKANIESTIKDILRPKNLDNTQELNLSEMVMEEAEEFSDFSIDESPDNKSSGTPSIGFNLKDSTSDISSDIASNISNTGEFDLSSVEFADKEPPEKMVKEKVQAAAPQEAPEAVEDYTSNLFTPSSEAKPHNSYVSDEESTRVQATIRQMREERDELLNQIKILKGANRELEQDNLTLKAALDESKIEVSILRKRHMVELEDIKYRLSINEEKKQQALEKARQAIAQKEKLEQRVRIDFNQVKLREKELETKLEMLSIDVDSQVQSRDQKILELRRKIDSLEFNMENVSIKEHKSQDDKRKLEDKLNKIMKTLRHSIKNLEDDIDQATDASQDDRQNAGHRPGKI